MRKIGLRIIISSILICCLSSWGFFGHEQINKSAIYTLPEEIILFFKTNQDYIIKHASDPDKRRYIDTLEGARHYLDVELFEPCIDSIPRNYQDAVKKYGINKLNKHGLLPWQIQKTSLLLTHAMKIKDGHQILKYSTELAHYIGDAHVPLHTTENHNGQLTNQHGIHGFWESRIPELYFDSYNLWTGKAKYISNTLIESWFIVKSSNLLVDSVLKIEKKVDSMFPSDKKFTFSKRKNILVKQYAKDYCEAYQKLSNNLTERRFRSSIQSIGNFWFTAWVNAGQPYLNNIKIKFPQKIKRQKKVPSIKIDSTLLNGRI